MRYSLFPRYDKFNGPTDPEVRRNKTRHFTRNTGLQLFFMVFKPFVSRRQLTMKKKKKEQKTQQIQ